MPVFSILFFALGMMILLPVILPIVAISHGLYLRRLRAAAVRFHCLVCGHILGQDAIAGADAAWAEHVTRLQREFPNHQFRLVRDVRAICPECRIRYGFDESAKTFFTLDA